MQKSTLQKILSDPEFDPHMIFEEALVNYINEHPQEVGKDRVALKWLVLDQTIVQEIANIIDVNDIEMVIPLIETINKPMDGGGYYRNAAKTILIKKLSVLKTEHIDAILACLGTGELSRPSVFPKDFITKLSADQIDGLTQTARLSAAILSWGAKDWEIATRTTTGISEFISQFTNGQMNLEVESLQLISKIAKIVGNTEQGRMLIKKVDTLWKTYVCFNCGNGTDIGRHSRGFNPDSHLIKSISGYTLHRKKCDPAGEFLSPHEILFGKPKELSFDCPRCRLTCTTLSGLTLHTKTCKS